MFRLRCFLSALMLGFLSFPGPLVAETFLGELEWSALLSSELLGVENLQIDGSATFVYDTSGVSAVGEDQLFVYPLQHFSMSPSSIWTTVWDLSNTAALLEFSDGQLQYVHVGDSTRGEDEVRTLSVGYSEGESVDDFSVLWRGSVIPQSPGRIGFSRGIGGGGISFDNDVTFSAVVVPEPATLSLLTLAGIALLLRTRPWST